jgi:hypothetical protein
MFREGTVKSPFAKAQFEIIADLGGYLKLTTNNPSSKKMTGITVYLKDPLGLKSEFLFQIDNEINLNGPTEQNVVIGDLQPHQSRSLHIWSRRSYSSAYYKNISALIEVTADEYHKRPTRFPLPNYLKTYWMQKFTKYFAWTMIVLFLIESIFFIVPAMTKH